MVINIYKYLCHTSHVGLDLFFLLLTLNLLPTLMKLSFPAFCFTSLLLLEFSNSSRTKRSLDSLTRHSRDMCRASLFFSTNLVWRRNISAWTGRSVRVSSFCSRFWYACLTAEGKISTRFYDLNLSAATLGMFLKLSSQWWHAFMLKVEFSAVEWSEKRNDSFWRRRSVFWWRTVS